MKLEKLAFNALEEVTESELDEILGAKGGSGAIPTISHDCHMNTWQFLFTCCS
ncbi:MAG: type A2 lantipeptide [Bacteroidales bacterium]|jgi:hypothetical protein|nr:type A2 lantipeptide [Bacteroidales bacterium]